MSGSLKLELNQLRNLNGQGLLFIYNQADGYPTKPKKAFKTETFPLVVEGVTEAKETKNIGIRSF